MSKIQKKQSLILGDKEFFYSYLDKDDLNVDIPLWWKRDVPVNLTRRERLKEIKRQNAINSYIAEQHKKLKEQNDKYLSRIKEAEISFNKKLSDNDELVDLKLKEIEIVANENAAILEQELILNQEKLQSAEQEKLLFEAELKGEELIKKKQVAMLKKFDEIQDKLSKTNEMLAKELSEVERLKQKIDEVRLENIKREQEHPDLATIGREAVRDTILNKIVIPKYYEESDPNNVLELRDIHFKFKYENDFIFRGINVFIKKQKVSIIYSEKIERLNLLKQIIYRSYPSDYHMIQGVVRINGKEAGRVPKSEYKEAFGGYLDSLTNKIDALKRHKGNIKSFINGYYEKEMKPLIEFFEIPYKSSLAKVNKLDKETIELLGLVCLIQAKSDLKIIENPEDIFDKKNLQLLITFLNVQTEQSILLTTTSLDIINKITDAKVFRI